MLSFFTGLALFAGMGLQQYALLKSQISNASFLTTLYVPIVSIISRFVFKSRLSWIIWIAVVLCINGSYLLTFNQSWEVKQSDGLLFLSAFFFAIHIILIDVFIKRFSSPFSFAFLQYFIVFLLSLLVAFNVETQSFRNIQLAWFEIFYAGVLSIGVGYTLQIIGQAKASPTPAAIILSMESVFAVLAAWFILGQLLDIYKIIGCCFIFIGVVLVQFITLYSRKHSKLKKIKVSKYE